MEQIDCNGKINKSDVPTNENYKNLPQLNIEQASILNNSADTESERHLFSGVVDIIEIHIINTRNDEIEIKGEKTDDSISYVKQEVNLDDYEEFSLLNEVSSSEQIVDEKNFNQCTAWERDLLTDENEILCGECQEYFATKLSFWCHLKIHYNRISHNCVDCLQVLPQSYRHKTTSLKCIQCRYKCTLCNKAFKSSSSLSYHKRTHIEDKPFKCKQCNVSFIQSSNLVIHMRKHTGERPYKCLECSKSFSRGDSLKDHIRTHTGERPFNCKQCDKSFHQSSNLQNHIHTQHSEKGDFECTHCVLTFENAWIFKKHMRTHSEDRPFKCTQCNKCFKFFMYLKNHLSVHSLE